MPSDMTMPKVNIAKCVQSCTCVSPIRLVINEMIRAFVMINCLMGLILKG